MCTVEDSYFVFLMLLILLVNSVLILWFTLVVFKVAQDLDGAIF